MTLLHRLKLLSLASVAIVASACSTLTAPVLRHETGEPLGAGKYKLAALFDGSRIYSFVPTGSAAFGIAQAAEIFQGSVFGVRGTAGVNPRLDLHLGGFLSRRGGGWRVGAKHLVLKKNALSVSAMIGYGAHSSSGAVTYLTAGQPIEVEQVLSTTVYDLSFPVSYRFNPTFAVYSSLLYMHSSVTGTVENQAVGDGANDLGVNVGLRVNFDRYETDLEVMFLHLKDPISDQSRFVPYVGVSGGITF